MINQLLDEPYWTDLDLVVNELVPTEPRYMFEIFDANGGLSEKNLAKLFVTESTHHRTHTSQVQVTRNQLQEMMGKIDKDYLLVFLKQRCRIYTFHSLQDNLKDDLAKITEGVLDLNKLYKISKLASEKIFKYDDEIEEFRIKVMEIIND